MAQKLKFGNGTWATKEGSTLAYNDENNNFKPLPFTTTRNSIATRVNKEGLIEVVGNDIPRIDYTDSADGVLLLENSSTNLYSYSNKSSEWLKTNWTTTDNYAISPDGTQNAFRAVSLNNSGILYQTATGSSGVNTLSVYAKSNTSTNQKFRFFGNGNTLISNDFTVTNEWKRIEWSYTYSSVTSGIKGASNELSDILFFGFQHEVNDFATSYIPTSGSVVTRLADSCSQTPPSGVIGQTEGTVFAEAKIDGLKDSNTIVTLHNGSFSEYLVIAGNSVGNINAYIFAGGVQQVGIFAGTYAVNSVVKCAMAYKQNDVAFYINGLQIGTDSSATMASTSIFDVGSISFGNYPLHGIVKQAKLYNTRLSNSELAALTTI
jgi:hypothetical protein